jgi:hypothetical protein
LEAGQKRKGKTEIKEKRAKLYLCRYCIHLRSLNLNHFKMVEAMGLKITASRSPSMASLPYKI